jgi:hypothetical protein
MIGFNGRMKVSVDILESRKSSLESFVLSCLMLTRNSITQKYATEKNIRFSALNISRLYYLK